MLTDSGYKRIEQIRPGDIVPAYNDTTHTYGRKKVIRIFEHVWDTVYQLRIGEDVINTTSDHPFFVGGRWLRVKNLRAGDSVQAYSGAKLVIASIRLVAGRVIVHNFEVADYHTYYVSHSRVLVHNNGPCPYNGNSLRSSKAQHIYEIEDTHSGEVVKTGLSGGKKTAMGESVRALRQASKWNKAAIKQGLPNRYVTRIVSEVPAGLGARQIGTVIEKLNANALRAAGQLKKSAFHVRP